MPVYSYIASREPACAYCRCGFDLLQKMRDPELTICPECGGSIRRQLSISNVVRGDSHRMSEKHIEKHGFTQYRKIGKGVYEKTAGKGPKHITGD